MKIEKSWSEFERWLITTYPEFDGILNAGASSKQLQALETELNICLPDQFKQFYTIHNGQMEGTPGLFDGLEFLSLTGILLAWNQMNAFIESENIDILDDGIEADQGISQVYWKKAWIPFISDVCGNYYCLDLEPTIEGASGQIIALWLVPPDRTLQGTSIDDWFQRYVGRILAGDYVYSESVHGIVEIED